MLKGASRRVLKKGEDEVQEEEEEKEREEYSLEEVARRQLYEQKNSVEETVVDYKPKYYTI